MLGRIKTILPDKVSAGEITAGNETEVRSYSPEDIVSFIAQHAGAGIDWSETQLSEVLDSVSAVAFDFDTANNIDLGELVRFSKNGNHMFSVDGNGYLHGNGRLYLKQDQDVYFSTAGGAFGVGLISQASSTGLLFLGGHINRLFTNLDEEGLTFASNQQSERNTCFIYPQDTPFAGYFPQELEVRGANAHPDSVGANNMNGGDLIIGGGDGSNVGEEGKIVPTTGFRSDVVDSASAIAYAYDTSNSMSLGKLASWSNNGTEVFSMDSDGALVIDSVVPRIQIGNTQESYIDFSTNNQYKSLTFRRGTSNVLSLGGTSIIAYQPIMSKTPTGDQAPPDLTIQAAHARYNASSNTDGADLILKSGNSRITGDGNAGNIIIASGNSNGAGKKGVVTIENHIILGDDRTTNHNIVLSGLMETNKDAAGAVNWTLPDGAPRGFWGEIRKVEDFPCTLTAPAGVVMIYDGDLLPAASVITVGKDYGGLKYKAVDSNLWLVDTSTVAKNGFMDYNHTGLPIPLAANTWTSLANNGLGVFTNKTYRPSGVSELLDTSTGQLDFTDLELGDSVLIRNDFTVTPNANNLILEIRYVLGTGANQYTLEHMLGTLDTGSSNPHRFALKPDFIYMGDLNTRDNPGDIQLRLSGAGTVDNLGTVIQTIKRTG